MLSILYLRCPLSAVSIELRTSRLDTSFNSLFEMRASYGNQMVEGRVLVLSILYLRCGEEEVKVSEAEAGTFNSLFEMPIVVAAVWTAGLTCAFNSLFEMRRLRRTFSCFSSSAPFNSLFEMHTTRFERAKQQPTPAFNSLFEMPTATLMSRFGISHTPFNSLFEMHLPLLHTQHNIF